MDADMNRSRTSSRSRPRSLLGSRLWLRPPPAREGMRWRSFAAREDLVRSDPPPLPPEGGGEPGSAPEILLAFDPWGAPAVLFALREGPEETEVRFAVPADATGSLREALRLLVDLLRLRGTSRPLWTRLPSPAPGAPAALEAAGWIPDRDRVWRRASGAESASPAETSRAG